MAARVGADARAMQELWARTVDEVKRSVSSTTAYRALEKTHPVAWEDDAFAIGFSGSEGQLAAQLNTGEYQSLIERVLQTQTGNRNLKFRIIDGMTYEDWEHSKLRDAAVLASRQQELKKRVVESKALTSWDEAYDQVSRLWASAEFRSLPSGKGRFFGSAFNIVLEAMTNIYPKEGKSDDPTERGLSRVIERIASMTNSDASVVAYLLFERWRERKAG